MTIGIESWNAVWMPMDALVAPGPREHDARLARQSRVGIGHECGAGLVPRDDELDHLAPFVEGVENREIALARDAERVVHALDQQLVDEDAGAGARGHAGGLSVLGQAGYQCASRARTRAADQVRRWRGGR
jgi:hypothetical protein